MWRADKRNMIVEDGDVVIRPDRYMNEDLDELECTFDSVKLTSNSWGIRNIPYDGYIFSSRPVTQ